MSAAVSNLGLAWQHTLETSLERAKPGGLAVATLKPKLRTAQFLAGSSVRTKERIEAFSAACREKPGPGFSKQEVSNVDWGKWFANQMLVPQLAKTTEQVSGANKLASSNLRKHEIVSRQRKMSGALGKFVKVLTGLIPGGHVLVASTESVEAVHDIFKGLGRSVNRRLGTLVESLDEMNSLEAHLLDLEKCLYLIPSKKDVYSKALPTVKDADDRLNSDLCDSPVT